MATEVIIPWRGGCVEREYALAWVRHRYPWPVTLAECPEGPWIKGLAVMAALERSHADVVVVADGDVWCSATEPAVAAVRAGAPWAKPHDLVYRLAPDATASVLRGVAPTTKMPRFRDPYRGYPGGGIVVAPRSTLIDIPIDPRFEGWGGEDASWGWALLEMAGDPWRGNAPLFHLWHPPQEHQGKWGSKASQVLAHRYAKAHRCGRVSDLIREAHAAYDAHQQASDDHAPAFVH